MKSLSFVVALVVGALSAQADVIYSNLDFGSSPEFDDSAHSSVGSNGESVVARAQSFLPDYGYFVTDVKLALSINANTIPALPKTGMDAARIGSNLKVSLYSDLDDSPGSPIAEFFPTGEIGFTPSVITFTPEVQPLLSVDVYYWLVAEPVDGTTFADGYYWYKAWDTSPGETAEGEYFSGEFLGWNSIFYTSEGAYEINGIPTEIPEPGLFGLGVGAVALGCILIRRRRS